MERVHRLQHNLVDVRVRAALVLIGDSMRTEESLCEFEAIRGGKEIGCLGLWLRVGAGAEIEEMRYLLLTTDYFRV